MPRYQARHRGGGLLGAAALAVLVLMPPAPGRADEADAKAILQAMSDYLAGLDRFAFDYDATLDVVTKEDQKLQLATTGAATIGRPDRIRAARAGGFVDVEMLFDGTTFTVLGKDANAYAQVEMPGDLDHLIDELRNEYGVVLPAADLLLADSYAALMEGVIDVKDLGSGVIGGVECDHLAFRNEDVDWQIWIAHGERPYPCRYVITTTQMAQAPQYSVQVYNWRAGDEIAVDDFAFTNPTGATEVEPEALRGELATLPSHFSTDSGS